MVDSCDDGCRLASFVMIVASDTDTDTAIAIVIVFMRFAISAIVGVVSIVDIIGTTTTAAAGIVLVIITNSRLFINFARHFDMP